MAFSGFNTPRPLADEQILQNLEQQRLRIGKILKLWGVWTAGALLLMLAWDGMSSIWALVIVGGPVFGGLFYLIKQVERFTLQYRAQVGAAIMRQALPECRFDPQQGIDRTAFVASGLCRRNFAAYQSSDLVTGMLGATPFRMARVEADRLSYKIKETDNPDTRVFSGLLFICEAQAAIPGAVYLYSKLPVLNNLMQVIQPPDPELQEIPVSDPQLAQFYSIYASTPAAAQALLARNLTSALLELRSEQPYLPSLAFIGSQVFIALKGHALLKPSLSASLLDPSIFSTRILGIQQMVRLVAAVNGETLHSAED